MSAISREPARPAAVSVNDPDVRVFIGPNADKLIGKLRLLDQSMTSTGMTGSRIFAIFGFAIWPAVFLGAAWYLYRRMYLAALLIIAALALLGIALEHHGGDGAGSRNGTLNILVGFLAPHAYLSHVKRKVARIRHETSADAERDLRLRRAGEVDWISPSLLIGIVAGLFWWTLTA